MISISCNPLFILKHNLKKIFNFLNKVGDKEDLTVLGPIDEVEIVENT